MKKIKAILSIILVFAITVVGSGCMVQRNSINHYRMVKYLNNKYDDKFEFYKVYGGTLFGTDTQKKILCTSEKFPDSYVTVIYDTGAKSYYDNYIDIKYAKQLTELADDILSSVFQQEHYYFAPFEETIADGGTNDYDADITFEEYISKEGLIISVFVDYHDNSITLDEIERKLEKKIIEAGLCLSWLDVYLIEDYDKSIETDDSRQNELIVNGEYNYHMFAKMRDNTQFSEITWEK